MEYNQPFPTPPAPRSYPSGSRELFLVLASLGAGLLTANCVYSGGFNLGFSIASIICILISFGYLLSCGSKPTPYSLCLLLFSIVISAAFARTDDGFVKFVMLCFLTVSINLGLCLMAGKNRRAPGGAGTLKDAGFTLFRLGFGEMGPAFRGITAALHNSGPVGQKSTAILAGLGISVPILAVMIPLLIFSDAAFEGLMDQLPEFSLPSLIFTVFFGGAFAVFLYTRSAALKHYAPAPLPQKTRKGLALFTVNTVLGAVCLLYCTYLFSQLAYFVGGFSGILPEEYTLAQYARRGFFEMAWLCAINLALIAAALALSRQKSPIPKSTRWMCLFIALITEFLVVTASAKMFFYIGSYGLTRLRVLTQVILLFLALTTGLVAIRLFMPKLPYMKTVILLALLLGATVIWVDVDSFVAKYNVDAYLSGQLETVDVSHLHHLGDGAVPHIARLAEEAPDQAIAEKAAHVLEQQKNNASEDLRGWNYVNHIASKYLSPPVNLSFMRDLS